MKIFKTVVQCLATHEAYIPVDDDCSLEDAVKITQNRIDNLPVDNLLYVDDFDQICENECEFVTEEEKDVQHRMYRDKIYREVWKEHVANDIREFLKNNNMELDDEHIDKAATLYVMHGQYDCNLSYWSNIENVIKSVM